MRIERARASRDGRGGDRGDHQIMRDVDADRGRERLVLAQRDHGAAGARVHEPPDDHIGDDREGDDETIIGGFAQERQHKDVGQAEREGRDVVERHRALRQLDPVERDEPHHFGKADADDDEIRSADPKRDAPDQPPAQSGDDDPAQKCEPDRLGGERNDDTGGEVKLEPEGHEGARVGPDSEERNVAKRQLPGEAEQEIEAHRRDDEDAGRDEDVQDVEIRHPRRHQEEKEHARSDGEALDRKRSHQPIRSLRANRPVGRNSRMMMMSRNPIASR